MAKNGQGYQFDFGNRLRVATSLERYRYDGHGRRSSVIDAGSGKNRHYLYSQGGALAYLWDQGTGERTQYIQLAGSLVAARKVAGSGAVSVRYQHTDALGSPVAETNEQAAVVLRTAYTPYGASIGAVQDGVGYTGHVMDGSTGLTYMQQRYMDPTVGVFLSVDPVTAHEQPLGQFHRYRYATSNPYKFTDPDGRQAMGSPNDMAHPVTLEQSVQIISWVADGLDAVDQLMMAVPQGQMEHAVVGPVVIGLKSVAAEAKAVSALTGAKEIQSTLNSVTQTKVTTAVTETAEGIRVVSSSEGALRPAQRAALQAGEIAANGAPRTHAEVNGVTAAKKMGLTPTSVSPSRPACPSCQKTMNQMEIPIKDK